MGRMWPIAVVVAGLGSLGVANVLNARKSEAAAIAQAKLDRLPTEIAGWKAVPAEISEKQLRIAEAKAHLSRTYTRPDSKSSFSVLILFGEPGPLGAHTPEVCFAGAGFHQIAASAKRDTPGEAAEFWTAKFETDASPKTLVHVTWGWGTDGVWKASDNPRIDFAGRGTIYKLYVSRNVPSSAGKDDKDPTDEFLLPLLRELRTCLAAAAPPPA